MRHFVIQAHTKRAAPAGGKRIRTQFESCVVCEKMIVVPIYQTVQTRSYYIEGAGQLCEDCYADLYCISKTR